MTEPETAFTEEWRRIRPLGRIVNSARKPPFLTRAEEIPEAQQADRKPWDSYLDRLAELDAHRRSLKKILSSHGDPSVSALARTGIDEMYEMVIWVSRIAPACDPNNGRQREHAINLLLLALEEYDVQAFAAGFIGKLEHVTHLLAQPVFGQSSLDTIKEALDWPMEPEAPTTPTEEG